MNVNIVLDEVQAEHVKRLLADHIDAMDGAIAVIDHAIDVAIRAEAKKDWPEQSGNIQPSMRVSGFQDVLDEERQAQREASLDQRRTAWFQMVEDWK